MSLGENNDSNSVYGACHPCHSKDTHVTVNQAPGSAGATPLLLVPFGSFPSWASCCTKPDSRIKLTTSFFTIDADATQKCFKMGLTAAHVTARNCMQTGRMKGTKKHQITNQRGKMSKGSAEHHIGIKFKPSETQRSKSLESDKMIEPVISD